MNKLKQFILGQILSEEDFEEDWEDSEEMPDNRRTRMDGASRDNRPVRDSRSMRDSRRGVPGSGRGRMRNRRDNGGDLSLSSSEMREWVRNLEYADDSDSCPYTRQQILQTAQRMGVTFDEYSEKEFYTWFCVFYSDYCVAAKKYIMPDKELPYYIDMTRAFFEDSDASCGSEKLAMYYYAIACDE